MTPYTIEIQITRREVAALFWTAAIRTLRETGHSRSPRAWALVCWFWFRLRTFG